MPQPSQFHRHQDSPFDAVRHGPSAFSVISMPYRTTDRKRRRQADRIPSSLPVVGPLESATARFLSRVPRVRDETPVASASVVPKVADFGVASVLPS